MAASSEWLRWQIGTLERIAAQLTVDEPEGERLRAVSSLIAEKRQQLAELDATDDA